MNLKSWGALLNREFIEHRIAFLYFPLGILALLVVAALSAVLLNKPVLPDSIQIPMTGKIFEIGFLGLAALFAAYRFVVMFFYFGDAFSADRRNNAMFFWKSMPVSDLKILVSKFFAGTLLLPALTFVITLLAGIAFVVFIYVVTALVPAFSRPELMWIAGSFGGIAAFVLLYIVLTLLWYAPFFAWVGGLSAVFGRWSYALAFLIPALIGVVENILTYGRGGPMGGYFFRYLGFRSEFGLEEQDFSLLVTPIPFNPGHFSQRLLAETDWLHLGLGLVFSALVIYAASEYRRRRMA